MPYQITDEDRQALAECRKAFADQFMQPQFYEGEEIQEALMEAGLDIEDDKIYCRLSADGFMDCTDWSGPFDSAAQAAQELITLYADEWRSV